MNSFELLDTVAVGNTLGECVLWNERQQAVWWTDIHEAKLYRYRPDSREVSVRDLPERLASFGFTTDDDLLVCAFASGFALYRLSTGQVHWLARPESDKPHHRFNDGRVDRRGRFWAGTTVEHATAGATERGSIYRLTGDRCDRVLTGFSISNSICWSPDDRHFYVADSPTQTIRVYDFDAQAGEPRNPQEFARVSPPLEPDGSTTDSAGCLWNAVWAGGKVVRYAADGKAVDELSLPVSQPTCVALGGSDWRTLFVTTAKVGLTSAQLEREPQAGNLFIYRTPYTGLPEARFKLP